MHIGTSHDATPLGCAGRTKWAHDSGALRLQSAGKVTHERRERAGKHEGLLISPAGYRFLKIGIVPTPVISDHTTSCAGYLRVLFANTHE